jgi:endonuclease III
MNLDSNKQLFSEELGINVFSRKEAEIFKWFLAALLFGKPIQQEVAKKTYLEFKKAKILTPDAILRAGWNRLVKILDRGKYVRYDFSTATKLLEISKALKEKYGPLTNLHKQAKNSRDLEKRLIEFKGVGPVTTNIFLRELRTVWKKADPEPLPFIKKTAQKLKIKLPRNRKTVEFIRFEAELVREAIKRV